MINSKGKKTTANLSKVPLRIALKCSWSGSRIQTPDTLTASSTLSDAIASVASELPALFSDSSEDQPSMVYLRTTIWKKDWGSTTIAQILGESVTGSVLITLNLPGVIAPSLSGSDNGNSYGQNAFGRAQKKLERSSSTAPMDIDDETTVSNELTMNTTSVITLESAAETPSITNPILSPKDAIHQLLQQNFDAASKDCLLTILKIMDNIISKPQDPKVRSLRLTNPTIHDKIRSKKGGLEILYSIGFTIEQSLSMDLDPKITLPHENENVSILLYTRQVIEQVLVNMLGMSSEDLPTMSQPAQASSQHQIHSSQVPFDPYKPFAFNVQFASVGAADPTSIVPDGVVGPSLTEQRLDQLKKKQMKIERDLFRGSTLTLKDRNLVAYHPLPRKGAIVTVSASDESDSTFIGSSKGDASLIAGRLKRLEDERKKREEGGFTTSAMREVDKLMNTKIYSHTQVRVDFPDGSWLSAKFLPHEKVAMVKETLRSIFVTECLSLSFDLYVTPPKRLLNDGNSLTDEGLVPAAKIRFAWKDGNNFMAYFIRPEFFVSNLHGLENTALAYPESVPVVDTNKNSMEATPMEDDKRLENKSIKSVELSKEDELVRRMLGKQSSILRPKGQR